MTTQDPNEFLDGGGLPTAKFQVGTLWRGQITDLEVTQQREYNPKGPGAKKTWPDGNPMMQLVITIQTDVRDPEIEDDDGRRRIFVDGKRKREAVTAARNASGAKLAKGGMIAIKCTGEEQAEPGMNPAKLYAAEYKPPSAEDAANNLLGDTAPAPAAPAAPSNGQPAPVAAGTTGLL